MILLVKYIIWLAYIFELREEISGRTINQNYRIIDNAFVRIADRNFGFLVPHQYNTKRHKRRWKNEKNKIVRNHQNRGKARDIFGFQDCKPISPGENL